MNQHNNSKKLNHFASSYKIMNMKKIKYILLFGFLSFFILPGTGIGQEGEQNETSKKSKQADAIAQYFQNYMNDTSFTSVYISPKMFSMIGKLKVDDMDPEVRDMMESLKGLRVLTTSQNAAARYREALNKFNTSEYESLMTVQSASENVNFFIKNDGNLVSELLLLVGGDEFVMLSLIGDIDLDKISKLASEMDVKGSEHLEKVKKK